MHALAAPAAEYVPCGQLLQAPAADAENFPSGQLMQAVDTDEPVTAVYWPAAQPVQPEGAPGALW